MYKMSKLTAVCFLALTALGVGCKSDGGFRSAQERTYEPERTAASQTADKMANREHERSAVFAFPKGVTELTMADKDKLKRLVTTLGVDNISRVEIASWSDKNFPMIGADLSKPDKELADTRADHIKDYLKEQTDLSTLRIRKYSMAETSNWLARMLRTDDAELKSIFSKEGEAPMVSDDFNLIKREGGPSKAVVVFIIK